MNEEINNSAPVFPTENKPKSPIKKIILTIIIIFAVITAGILIAVFIIAKPEVDEKMGELKAEQYQEYVDMFGDAVSMHAEFYYVENGRYPTFDEIKKEATKNIEDINCKDVKISSTGDIEVSKCTIKGYKYNSSIKYVYKDDSDNSLSLTGKVVVDKTTYHSIKDGNVLEKNNIKVELKDYKVYVSDKKVGEYDTTISAYFMDNLVIIATYGTDEGSTKILFVDVNGNILKEISKINDNFALSDVNVGDDYYSFVIDGNKVYFGATVHPNGELVNENFDCLESSITDAIYYVTVDGTTISEPRIYDSMTLAQDSNGSEYCD